MTDSVKALNARANALYQQGRFRDALATSEQALAIEPPDVEARVNAGVLRLLLGDFEQGWKDYEARRIAEPPTLFAPPQGPEWDGGRVDGVLLAWAEQGLGDQILFLGLAEALAARAAQLVLAVEPRLVRIVQRSLPGCRVIEVAAAARERFDAQIPLASAGRYLRRSWAEFPSGRAAYLRADPAVTAALRSALHADRRVLCGVSWRSSAPRMGAAKSVPLERLGGLLRLPGLTPVNLQYGDRIEEHEALARLHGVKLAAARGVNRMGDVEALAALVSACDVVVTISNAMAHLAGALGRPTCLLLPAGMGRHWYWHSGTGRNPWYPTVRMFTQAAQGDWSGPIAAVTELVSRRLGPRARPPVGAA